MTTGPKISVIIPIYNTAEYLPRCLDSILNNTYRNLEVICVDDGSTDGSADIVKGYAGGDLRVISVVQKNAGVSAARNAGLDIASGDFIAFIDSDDWVHPQYFEVLMNGHQETGADVTVCNYINSRGLEAGTYASYVLDNIHYDQYAFCKIGGNGHLKRLATVRLYEKDIVVHTRFDTGLQWGEDTVFNLSALLANDGVRLTHIDLPLYFCFSRNNSLSNTVRYEHRLRLPKWYLDHYSEFKTADARQYILEQACRDVLSSRYAETFSLEKDQAFSACKSIMKECIRELRKSRLSTPLQTLKYQVLFHFPWIYRAARILDDPTLRQWEKEQKRRRISE